MNWDAPRDKATDVQLERRRFLGLLVGSAAWLSGCGDGSGVEGLDGGTEGNDDGSEGSGDTTSADDGTGGSTMPEGDDSTGEGGETLLPFDPEAIPEDKTRFPQAVLAGEMKPESAMLATWIADGLPKTLRVWTEGDVLVTEQTVTPDEGGFVKTPIEGLEGGKWYKYAFFNDSDPETDGEPTARSLIGEFRAALAEDALEPVTFAVTSCCGDSFNWPALDRMSEEYFDAFLHVGDMAYCDGAFTRDEFRSVWHQYLRADGYRRIFSRGGSYITWDDHEIDDNSNFDRETMNPDQLEKRANAMDAFFETVPIDTSKTGYRMWRSFTWGKTAEVIVLDSRYERRRSDGRYMSQEQMDWLKQRLLESPCHFKVIMNSVPITNMPGFPAAWDVTLGAVGKSDRWEGFPEHREELLGFINEHNIQNVWFVSGDFHVCFVSRLEENGDDLASNIREVAVTGGNTNSVGLLLPLPAPQFDYGVNAARGLVMTFDPHADTVNVRFLDPNSDIDDYAADLKYPGR